MMAVMHIDKVVLQGLSECVETGSKLKGFMSSVANAAKSADKRQAKRGLSADGCMQLGAEVSHLVRLIALAQPKITGAADVYTLMTVHKWAEVRPPVCFCAWAFHFPLSLVARKTGKSFH